jgi:hypothetical protein
MDYDREDYDINRLWYLEIDVQNKSIAEDACLARYMNLYIYIYIYILHLWFIGIFLRCFSKSYGHKKKIIKTCFRYVEYSQATLER